ncbi:hypothetical protein Bca4012_037533 [Brassica carinata]
MYNYVGLNSPTAICVLKAALSDEHVRLQVCLRCLTLLFYGIKEATKGRMSYCMETL